jgi:hypothetical protein
MQPVSLGQMSVSKLFEMESGPPLPLIMPQISAEDLAQLAAWYTDDTLGPTPQQSAFMMSMHSYVLQIGGRNILIDACNGNDKQRAIPDVNMAQTPYLANLAALGLAPGDIDLVLCTHLHFDHVGCRLSPTRATCSRAGTSSTSVNGSWKTTICAPSGTPCFRFTRPGALS